MRFILFCRPFCVILVMFSCSNDDLDRAIYNLQTCVDAIELTPLITPYLWEPVSNLIPKIASFIIDQKRWSNLLIAKICRQMPLYEMMISDVGISQFYFQFLIFISRNSQWRFPISYTTKLYSVISYLVEHLISRVISWLDIPMNPFSSSYLCKYIKKTILEKKHKNFHLLQNPPIQIPHTVKPVCSNLQIKVTLWKGPFFEKPSLII